MIRVGDTQFCRNLYVFRKIAGLSRVEAAAKIGVGAFAVWTWETGRASPKTPETLQRIAVAYGVKVSDIMSIWCEDGPEDIFPDCEI